VSSKRTPSTTRGEKNLINACRRSRNKIGVVWDMCHHPVENACLLATHKGLAALVDGEVKWLDSRGVAPDASAVAFAPTGSKLAVGDNEGHIEIRQWGSWRLIDKYKHGSSINRIAWSPDGELIASCADDRFVRLHSIRATAKDGALVGHKDSVFGVAFLGGGEFAATASKDRTIRLWDVVNQKCIGILNGHAGAVNALAVLPDPLRLVSGSDDATIRIWDVDSRCDLGIIEAHVSRIWSVTSTRDGALIVSASDDGTVRVWDPSSGGCLRDYSTGSPVYAIAGSPLVNEVLFTGLDSPAFALPLPDFSEHTQEIETARSLRYTSAKIVLVGDTHVGKSCLADRLIDDVWRTGNSTHGMRVFPLEGSASADGIAREVWLWDLAGQSEYRLIHQLFLSHTSVALVLVDVSSTSDQLADTEEWNVALRSAIGHQPVCILVGTKADASPHVLTEEVLETLRSRLGYSKTVLTSARTGQGRTALLDAVSRAIPWDRLPWCATPLQLRVLREKLSQMRDAGIDLITFESLEKALRSSSSSSPLESRALRDALGLLEKQYTVVPLGFRDLVLLRPELLSMYASSVIRAGRQGKAGLGVINERVVIQGKFDLSQIPERNHTNEQTLLAAVLNLLVQRAICIRQMTEAGAQLVFPSEVGREIPELPAPISPRIYRFACHLPSLFATLVARLAYAAEFGTPLLWRNTAVFHLPSGAPIGFCTASEADGSSILQLFVGPGPTGDGRILFEAYIREHLRKHAMDLVEFTEHTCPSCGAQLHDERVPGDSWDPCDLQIRCRYCNAEISSDVPSLPTAQQQGLTSRVLSIDANAERALDNQSKEQILIGEVTVVVGMAEQIFRPTCFRDLGIDGEIEFRHDDGSPSGKKVCVQLKSGDSHLTPRERDGANVFRIKNERLLKYWKEYNCPVYLIIRHGPNQTEWMDIRAYLRQHSGEENPQLVRFQGDPFTHISVLEVRRRVLET